MASERPAQYAASGSFALVYDQAAKNQPLREDPRSFNPLASDGGQLLSEALIAELTAPSTQRQLGTPATRGEDSTKGSTGAAYSVQLPDNSVSITVNAFSADGRAAAATVDRVLGAAATHVRAIQTRAGAPAESQLSVFVTVPAQVTVLPPPSKAKLVVAITGVGGLAGAALSLLVDRLLARRRRRLTTTKGFLKERRDRAATTMWEPMDDPDESTQQPHSSSTPVAARAAQQATNWSDTAERSAAHGRMPGAEESRDLTGDAAREAVRT